MNDQLLMDNYLLILKSTMEVYVHGTLESSNQDIRDLLKSCLDETVKHQARTYDEMTQCGWYQVKSVNKSDIKQILNKINET